MRRVRCVRLGCALLAGCARYESLGAGEVLTAGDGRRDGAAVVEAASGIGGSGTKASTFVEARGRVLVSEPHQQIAALAGMSRIEWLAERAPVWGHLGGGLGFERSSPHASSVVVVGPLVQARLGTGFVLRERRRGLSALNAWGIEAAPCPEARTILRTRTLLTLALTADVDFRFTRNPLFTTGLTVGVARLEEPRVRTEGRPACSPLDCPVLPGIGCHRGE